MIINSTNNNKTNNHLSSELIEKIKKPTTYDVGDLGSALRQEQTYCYY
jgi:hypothetical protein